MDLRLHTHQGIHTANGRTHRRATTRCHGAAQANVAGAPSRTHQSPTLDYLNILRAREGDPHAPPLMILAPMENLADRPFRVAHARSMGGFDEACTEFLRVPDKATHPYAVAKGVCGPYDADELQPYGLVLGAQIMGSNPELLGIAAQYLARVKRAPRVDLNCGCPANTVTGNGAGSSLLRTPDRLHECAKAMVKAAGQDTLITLKMRAGYADTSLFKDNLLAAQEAGVGFITLHARTKMQTYDGHADLDLIARAREILSIPVVGNGDVVSVAAARRMLDRTGCQGLCIGRGAVQDPLLFLRIRTSFLQPDLPWTWDEPAAVQAFLRAYASEAFHPHRSRSRSSSPDKSSPPPSTASASQGTCTGDAAGGGHAGGLVNGHGGHGSISISERGKFGKLKKVMKYLFNSSAPLAEACDHLLRVQPGTGVSSEELVELLCQEIHKHWPPSGPNRLALVNHMSKDKPLLVSVHGP